MAAAVFWVSKVEMHGRKWLVTGGMDTMDHDMAEELQPFMNSVTCLMPTMRMLVAISRHTIGGVG